MPQPLSPQLRALQEEVECHARAYGLDFFEIIYEVLDWEEINEVAAYGGYPARYPHWRFGMDYEQLAKGEQAIDRGLQVITMTLDALSAKPAAAMPLNCRKSRREHASELVESFIGRSPSSGVTFIGSRFHGTTPRRLRRTFSNTRCNRQNSNSNTPMAIRVHQELNVPSKMIRVWIIPSIKTPTRVPAM